MVTLLMATCFSLGFILGVPEALEQTESASLHGSHVSKLLDTYFFFFSGSQTLGVFIWKYVTMREKSARIHSILEWLFFSDFRLLEAL